MVKPPKGWNKTKRAEYLGHLRNGMRPGAAAEAMGFDRKAILDLLDEDDELKELVADAEREATEHVEEALYQAAVSGNITAARIWLDLRKKPSTSLVPADQSADFDAELAELNRIASGKGPS